MHPAFSVIFFTVTSGTGYGILFFTALLGIVNTGTMLDPDLNIAFAISIIIGLIMVALGIISSTLHLANPKNVWRAFFRFKSSWLSKEGVFAVISFPIALLFLASFGFGLPAYIVQFFAVITMLIAVLTIFSTGMIYACLKTIRAWNSPIVPVNYILLGLLSGVLALMVIMNYYGLLSMVLEVAFMVLLAIGITTKIIYYFFIANLSNINLKSATGLTGKNIKLLDNGESSDNFLTKEFGFIVRDNKILLLKFLMLTMVFIVPSILLFTKHSFFYEILALSIINYLGVMIERWLFFAEAKHIVNLFYGRKI